MVDDEVVIRKLGAIERYLRHLRDEQQIDEAAYLDNDRTQRVVERLFNNLINTCIDLVAHIRAAEELPDTGSAAGDMQSLVEAGILPEPLGERMIEMTGFRNALTHDYEAVRQPEVYRQLQDLDQFERFAEALVEYYQDELR